MLFHSADITLIASENRPIHSTEIKSTAFSVIIEISTRVYLHKTVILTVVCN